MSTIKQNNNLGPSSVSAALTEAQSIIAAAEQRAQEIIGASERNYKSTQEEAYKNGFAQGRKEAAETAIRLIQESSTIGNKLSEEAAKLAIAVSGAVIGEHVKVDPELVKKIAARALQQSVVGDVITVLANHEDQQVLIESIDYFRRLSGGASVSIEVDPTISRGGCIVRTEFGEVDASIPVLLESVATQLGLRK